MAEWLKANGGPPGAAIVGIGLLFAFWPLGVVFLTLALLLWANGSRRVPYKVVREPRLALGIEEVNFSRRDRAPCRIDLIASVRNLGSPTILHSWQLEFRVPPNFLRKGTHVGGGEPTGKLAGSPLLETTTNTQPCQGTERGTVCFAVIEGFSHEDLLRAKGSGVLVLSVEDRFGQRWATTQQISELAKFGESTDET